MMRVLWILLAYWRTRRLTFSSRAELEAFQARKLAGFMRRLSAKSSYFAPFKDQPLTQWPGMDKAVMMANFDSMNTRGLSLKQVLNVALGAESSRDFTPAIADTTVGLSSGTSAQRGVFAVSARERAEWAGIMLAKALPDGLFSGERVALFLRANSNLYTTVQNRWLTFEFFDLFQPFEHNVSRLAAYRPSIIVAPAQVLRALALAVNAGQLQLAPKRVISVAEVLEPQDRQVIEQAFGQLHEIYQATEGFLASTCEHGVLHLNEEYIHVEPQWLDEQQHRFVPIITDFSRWTQPIVRYRLNDVLAARQTPCPCGRATRALDRIEGRCDDLLTLPGVDGKPVPVFPDMLSRALAQVLPMDADYRLIQQAPLALTLHAEIAADQLAAVRTHIEQALRQISVDVQRLSWTLLDQVPAFNPTIKRRRIIRAMPMEENHV
ncbi:F390 synthetase-related protein [Paraherbaspirillum soli]|uniref:F390 synthetase-related protein n=1 Tax=Paraherbaspirillum soli TaxID=631222 RepID=A0ABW0MBW0_9BURK